MSIPQIAFSQESKNLFDDHLQAKVEKLKKNVQMRVETPRCSLDGKLQQLLPRLQRSIVEQIEMLNHLPLAISPHALSFCWLGECVKLQNFYCSLRHLPRAASAVKACIFIREDADRKTNSLLTSRSHLANEEKELIQREILASAWCKIGKIAFCLDRAGEIEAGSIDTILQCAEKKVNGDLQKIWESLLIRSKVADAHALQPVDQVFFSQLPKEIAKILLTSQGQLNLGMIKSVKGRFFPVAKKLSEFEKGIEFVLDRIDSSWQKFFDEIKVPCNATIPSNALIRAELDLPLNEAITKLHCQQTALAALLSLLSNKQVSECLKTAWMMKRFPEFFFDALKDYAEIIHQGYLTRMIDGKVNAFFFENAFFDKSLFQKITLKRNKCVVEYSGAAFWKSPHLISACRQMGIEDLEKRKEMLLSQLAPLENGEKQVTWDKLIRCCAKSATSSKYTAEELIALGRYGFSLCENRLLKAWEACLAGTVDSLLDFSIRENINETVMSLFVRIFSKKTGQYERSLIKEMNSDLKKVLNSSFHLVYNEAIPLPYSFDDGSSTCGGFKLFQRDLRDLTHKGARIATPMQFKAFILGVIDTLSTPKERAVCFPSIIDDLQECVLKDDFVKKLICHYDEENASMSDPVRKYEHLGQTPMTSLCYNYCPEHLTLDTANHFNPDIIGVFLKNSEGLMELSKPKDLLKWMLNLAQWENSSDRYLDGVSFSEEIFYSELFSEGTEFQCFLSSQMMAEEWIQKTLVDPGLKISQAMMECESMLKYQKQVKAFLGDQSAGKTPRSVGRVEKFFEELNAVVEGMTVQQFAQRSYEGLLHIFKGDAELAHAMGLMLDSFLLVSLSAEQFQALQQSAVRFAAIDGYPQENPLFFCCFFNPRTEQLELGSTNQAKTGLKPIGMHEWLELATQGEQKR